MQVSSTVLGEKKQIPFSLRSLDHRQLPENLSDILASYSAESDTIDFKEMLDLKAAGAWCEILKDMVAMANSGGGVILVGVNDDGKAIGSDVTGLLALDPADVTNKFVSYTNEQFSLFAIVAITRNGQNAAAIAVESADIPLVFTSDGAYPDPNDSKKTKFAFRKGSIYFRHGAKSEPAVREDLRRAIDRIVQAQRESWYGNLRKVIEAPTGHQVVIVAPENNAAAKRVRLTNDPTVPAVHNLNIDDAFPYRARELGNETLKRIGIKISPHALNCIKKHHDIGKDTPQYFHASKFGSKQYSDLFLDWLVDSYKKDDHFIDKAVAACKSTHVHVEDAKGFV